jgi:hypothetical protein
VYYGVWISYLSMMYGLEPPFVIEQADNSRQKRLSGIVPEQNLIPDIAWTLPYPPGCSNFPSARTTPSTRTGGSILREKFGYTPTPPGSRGR